MAAIHGTHYDVEAVVVVVGATVINGGRGGFGASSSSSSALGDGSAALETEATITDPRCRAGRWAAAARAALAALPRACAEKTACAACQG